MRNLTIAVMSLLVSAGVSATTVEMTVNGLVCSFCAQGIEKSLRKLSATADVLVSLEHRLVAIDLKDGSDIADTELTRALEDAGYSVKAIRRTESSVAALREQLRGRKKQ